MSAPPVVKLDVVRPATLLRILGGFVDPPEKPATTRAMPEWAWREIERLAGNPRNSSDDITSLAVRTGRPRDSVCSAISAVRRRGYRPQYRSTA